MVFTEISLNDLDKILAFQFVIAWAGEGLAEPHRLNWWKTDLIDNEGGGDLFSRLFPLTHEWASLEAIRTAAIQADKEKRLTMVNSSMIRTMFFWGYKIDDKLNDRISEHKQDMKSPFQVLPFPYEITDGFNREVLEKSLLNNIQIPNYRKVLGGRELLDKIPEEPVIIVKLLAASFLPFSKEYPSPFYRIED